MAVKPLSVARQDYINALCQATNKSGLPAFVIVDVLENVLAEAKKLRDNELKADTAKYRAALQEESKERQVANDGGQEDK